MESPGGDGGIKTILNLKGRFVQFNGKTQPHETLEFTGERFTLVFYTSDIQLGEGVVDRRPMSATAGVSSDFAAKFKEMKSKLGKRKPLR